MAPSTSILKSSKPASQPATSNLTGMRTRRPPTEWTSVAEFEARRSHPENQEARLAIHDILKESQHAPQTALVRHNQQWRSPQEPVAASEQPSSRKAQYYNTVFASREQPNPAKERLLRTSILTAELKTNVVIKDEHSFLTSFSAFLSVRYNRPESSILITLSHSTCLFFGGSLAPAYLLSISAIPEQVKPTTNRRNTALVQRFLTEELNILPERGVMKFCPIEEGNFGTAGSTLGTSPATAEGKAEEGRPAPDNPLSFSKRFTKKSRPGNVAAARQALASSPILPIPTRSTALPTPPSTPPLPANATSKASRILGVDLHPDQNAAEAVRHSRSASEATTSSDPEVDILRNPIRETVDMSNFEFGSKRKMGGKKDSEAGKEKVVKGKKSGFFKRLVNQS